MKRLLLVLLMLAGCASVPPEQMARNSAVFVGSPDGHGSGVVINEKCVVTAAHVITEQPLYLLVTNDNVTHIGAVEAKDTDKDIAVVCVADRLNEPSVQLVDKMPKTYEPVFTIGFPLDKNWVLTEGRYQGENVVTAQSAPGSSGGGVFNYENKYVGFIDAIAVYPTDMGLMDFPHLATIIPATDVRAFLDANHITYRG